MGATKLATVRLVHISQVVNDIANTRKDAFFGIIRYADACALPGHTCQ